jgi:diguanylate cyclase (GGDEF)-like protein
MKIVIINTVALIVILSLVITIFRSKIIKIRYTESDKIVLLRNILNNCFTTNDPILAAKNITETVSKKYNLDYFTLFGFDSDCNRLYSLYSSADIEYTEMLETHVNMLLTKYTNTNRVAIIYRSKSNLDYPSATDRERNIRYMYFMPLILNDKFIGAILAENTSFNSVKEFSLDFFNAVLDNISISIEHLMFFKQIIMLANIDGLTKVFNKKYLLEQLSELIENCKISNNTFSLAIFDIDHFKKFNDVHGHLFGDRVLYEVAQLANINLRKNIDTIYRFGGEEFVIVFQGISKKEAFSVVEIIRKKIQDLELQKEDDSIVQLTCSFGISTFIENGVTISEVIKSADEALYISKNNGRNQTTCS